MITHCYSFRLLIELLSVFHHYYHLLYIKYIISQNGAKKRLFAKLDPREKATTNLQYSPNYREIFDHNILPLKDTESISLKLR